MSLPAKLAALLVALIAAVAGGYKLGMDVKQGQWDAATLARKQGQDEALQAAAREAVKIEVQSEKIIQPIRTEIRTNTVYRDCAHSPDSLRNLNALITGAEPAGGGVVPGASAPQ